MKKPQERLWVAQFRMHSLCGSALKSFSDFGIRASFGLRHSDFVIRMSFRDGVPLKYQAAPAQRAAAAWLESRGPRELQGALVSLGRAAAGWKQCERNRFTGGIDQQLNNTVGQNL